MLAFRLAQKEQKSMESTMMGFMAAGTAGRTWKKASSSPNLPSLAAEAPAAAGGIEIGGDRNKDWGRIGTLDPVAEPGGMDRSGGGGGGGGGSPSPGDGTAPDPPPPPPNEDALVAEILNMPKPAQGDHEQPAAAAAAADEGPSHSALDKFNKFAEQYQTQVDALADDVPGPADPGAARPPPLKSAGRRKSVAEEMTDDAIETVYGTGERPETARSRTATDSMIEAVYGDGER